MRQARFTRGPRLSSEKGWRRCTAAPAFLGWDAMTGPFDRNRAATIAARLTAALAFFACWSTVLDYGITDYFVLAMLLAYILGLIAIFVHEAGHALAASHYRQ